MGESNGKTIIGTVNNLGDKLIGAIPPQFLVLVLITAVFNLGMLWFLDRREQQRERLFGPYLSACEKQVPVEALTNLLDHLRKGPPP